MPSKKRLVQPADPRWDYAMLFLKRARPQQTLRLWSDPAITVEMFFRLSRKIRQVILTPQPVFDGEEVKAIVDRRTGRDGLPYYVVEIKEDLSLEEQVLCFLHELGHIAIWQQEFRFPPTWTGEDIEWFAELLAVQFLETCDYYAYAGYLNYFPVAYAKHLLTTL